MQLFKTNSSPVVPLFNCINVIRVFKFNLRLNVSNQKIYISEVMICLQKYYFCVEKSVLL